MRANGTGLKLFGVVRKVSGWCVVLNMGDWDFPNTVHKNRFVGTTLLTKLLTNGRVLLPPGGKSIGVSYAYFHA